MVDSRCQNCKWFDPEHESLSNLWRLHPAKKVGYCRKHKPVIYQGTEKNGQFNLYYGGWPLVDINDFCGEFRLDEVRE